MKESISNILRHRNNWVKNDYESGDGKRVCLTQAASDAGVTTEERRSLAKTVRELFPERVAYTATRDASSVLICFNDHVDTRFDHIKKVIDEFERRIAD